VVRGWEPTGALQLLLWRAGPEPPLAIARVDGHVVDAVGVQDDEMGGVESKRLRALLARRVPQLNPESELAQTGRDETAAIPSLCFGVSIGSRDVNPQPTDLDPV
jgi:hypothetical protein